MKKKFKVGDKVIAIFDYAADEFVKLAARYPSYDIEELVGEVDKTLANNCVEVSWNYLNCEAPTQVNQQFLLSEKDYAASSSQLEKEFEVVAKRVKGKLTQAAELVKEAKELARKAKLKIKVMEGVWNPLLNEMSRAGWNSSDCY
jgi:hypothetical protein